MKTQKTPHTRRGGNPIDSKRARLVRLMLEIASLDRDEYRRLRTEMWISVAKSHSRKPAECLREWRANAS